MLHILLLILKIIGIVFLCILCLLVLGICCMLFVPVRYRVEVSRREGEGEPPVTVQIKVTWLLHMVNLLVRFTGTLFVRARILLFTVFRLPQKEKKKDRKRRREMGKNRTGIEASEEKEETACGETDAETGTQAQDMATDGVSQSREAAGEATDKASADKPSMPARLRALPEILKRIFEKIIDLVENIQYTIRNICDKISSILERITYYQEILESETFKSSFALCKGELIAIAKSLKPKKCEVSLIVGMEDPASTGQILSVFGMLYPLLGGYVDVTGDFERKRLEGRIFLKGKLRFFTFLRVAGRIYFNKDIKKLYRLLKKEAV